MELLRYMLVGFGSNLINFILYLICNSVGISLFISSVISYSIGMITSFHFGRIWIFSKKFEIDKKNVIRFTIVYIIGGLGMSVLIDLLNKTMEMDFRISWLFGAAFAVLNNFLGLKWFVFKKE